MKLTEREARELEYKRQVYELAKRRKTQEEELARHDEYRLPEAYDGNGAISQSKRYEVLTARYRCTPPISPGLGNVINYG